MIMAGKTTAVSILSFIIVLCTVTREIIDLVYKH